MTERPGREPSYAELIAKLSAFRTDHMQGRPSDRSLAQALGVSPTTVGDWLRAERFPQRIDLLLALVRAVRGQAEVAGLADDPAAARLLDPEQWRSAYRAEARRRADGTSAAVQAEQGRAVLERMRPGQPLAEVTDPFDLEVHRAVDFPATGLPVLPVYVPREHDRRLAEVVARAAAGASQIAVLVGGSSTGKTRACWQALTLLRGQEEPWRLWHPIDPARPDAALAELADIGPYTVIWLNEAQFYLEPDALGERVAAGLRTLLRDPRRSPVLVLATLWPNHWETLTARTDPDVHAQAREVLDGHKIPVPDVFAGTDLAALTDMASRDPRLGEAVERVQDGQITQYLAGVPVLMDRYQEARGATRALIHAAMDARRLGAGPRIPLALLADAAPGYLTEREWDHTGDDWLQQALDYVTKHCNGIPGILASVKTSTLRNQRIRPAAGYRPRAGQGPLYQLADYLDQHGRRHRADQIPPIDFWTAAAAHAHPTDLPALGDAAWNRGLYRDAAQLHKHATTHGNPHTAAILIEHLHTLHPADHRPAHHATHAALDDPDGVSKLLDSLRRAGADGQVTLLLARDPAAHAALDAPHAVSKLLYSLWRVEGEEQVAALLARDPATHAHLDSPAHVGLLLDSMRKAGADGQVTALAERAAAHAAVDDPAGVCWLLDSMRKAGAAEQVTALAERAAAHAPLDDPYPVGWLLDGLRKVGADGQVTALAERVAAHAPLDDPAHVGLLLDGLRKVGAAEQVTALAERAAAHAALGDDPADVASLLYGLRRAGADGQVTSLLARDPAAHVALDDPAGVALLLGALEAAGADGQVTTLLARDPAAHVHLNSPRAVAWLLRNLREAGADGQVTALLMRDPAAHVALNNDAADVAELLGGLQEAGADGQVITLLARDSAAHVHIKSPAHVGYLLERLREAGADGQATSLLERLPAAGYFAQYTTISDQVERFKFGREPDGSAAALWRWDDLE
ncbi:hypothetical protein ACTPOK_20170 [Streptomyces inhibens]|uniref:hypothetical protein n=1 Tax=Streptomyces inhibens TaxID=2293571 RepID=UPI00402A9271